jgi:hypothetical protein
MRADMQDDHAVARCRPIGGIIIPAMLTVRQRALVSGGLAVCIVLVLSMWPMEIGPFRPSTFVLVVSSTWFGPTLLFTLPLLVVWMSFAAETHEGASVGIGVSMLVFVLCLGVVWYARSVYQGFYGPF